jgi:hypothetical protein
MNAEGRTYGRFGGRDAGSSDRYLTVDAFHHALRSALEAHRAGRIPTQEPGTGRDRVEDFPAAGKLRGDACIHCHQVYDFRREERQARGEWSREEVWGYPLPENIGLTLDFDQGPVVRQVAVPSPAAAAGIKVGDRLTTLRDRTVASFADVQYALHGGPPAGKTAVTWTRAGRDYSEELVLSAGWRKTDISWRASMWGLGPTPVVQGTDLTTDQKRALGLSPGALAFRQGSYVAPPARLAGIRQHDVILGIDGKDLSLTMRQFQAHVRLHYQVGDIVEVNILRDGQRLNVPLMLRARAE